MCVFVSLHSCTTYMQLPTEAKEGIGACGTGSIDYCKPLCVLGTEPRSSAIYAPVPQNFYFKNLFLM